MKVFITGGNGYIGSNIIKKLLEAQHEVYAVVRPQASLRLLEAVKERINFFYYDGSFTAMQKALLLAKPEVVIHLASCFIAEHQSQQIDELVDANIRFGLHLLQAMKDAGVGHLINTGTYSQYFHADHYEPAYLYDATKQAFEDLAYFYHKTYGFNILHLMLYDNYGPSDPRKKLLSFFNRASTAQEPILMSAGEQKLDMIYIDDAVRAYLQAIDVLSVSTEVNFKHYAVCTGKLYSLREIARMYEEARGVSLNIKWGGLPYRQKQIMAPCSHLPRVPQWQAQVSLAEGLARVIKSEVK